jgi:hypothetical protein
MPFGVSIGQAATRQGIPRMTLGGALQPMIQRGENQRLWNAFKAGGLIPEGTDIAPLAQAGVDPRVGLSLLRQMDTGVPMKDLPGFVDMVAPGASSEERERLGAMRLPRSSVDDWALKMAQGRAAAETLRQEMAAAGVPPEEMRIGGWIDPASAVTYREQIRALRKERDEAARRQRLSAQVGQIVGQALPPDLDPTVAGNLLSAYTAAQQQARTFAQQEKLRGMTEGSLLERQRINREAENETKRMNDLEKSYLDEASRYQAQINETLRARNVGKRQIDQSVLEGFAVPEEAARRKAELDAEYQESSAIFGNARDLARMRARQLRSPVPPKQTRMTADELSAYLSQASHDPKRQKNLLARTQRALESNSVVGLSPEDFFAIRQQFGGGNW